MCGTVFSINCSIDNAAYTYLVYSLLISHVDKFHVIVVLIKYTRAIMDITYYILSHCNAPRYQVIQNLNIV